MRQVEEAEEAEEEELGSDRDEGDGGNEDEEEGGSDSDEDEEKEEDGGSDSEEDEEKEEEEGGSDSDEDEDEVAEPRKPMLGQGSGRGVDHSDVESMEVGEEEEMEDGMEVDDGGESLSAVGHGQGEGDGEVSNEGRRSFDQVGQEGEELDRDGEAPRARKRTRSSLSPQTEAGKKKRCPQDKGNQAEGMEEVEPADEVQGEQHSGHSH